MDEVQVYGTLGSGLDTWSMISVKGKYTFIAWRGLVTPMNTYKSLCFQFV